MKYDEAYWQMHELVLLMDTAEWTPYIAWLVPTCPLNNSCLRPSHDGPCMMAWDGGGRRGPRSRATPW